MATDDDGRTRRWDKIPRLQASLDPLQALRACLQQVKKVPKDLETRRQLRAIAAEQGLWDQLALLLSDEARAASHRPELALAFYEELVDVYEQLDQTLEMIAAMESVVALDPTNADHQDRLAWLYRRAGAWSKAAEAFEQVGELSRDNRARAALRAAAQIYRENRRLDRAAEVYRTILNRKPSDDEAWRSLDDVLSELGRWRELAQVRAERASRADGVEKAALLRAQARALEQAGDRQAAAELVARAAQHAPEDVSGLVDYVEVLSRNGQHREAAEILRKRIADALGERAGTSGDGATSAAAGADRRARPPEAKPAGIDARVPSLPPLSSRTAQTSRAIPSLVTKPSRPPTTLGADELESPFVASDTVDQEHTERAPTSEPFDEDDHTDPGLELAAPEPVQVPGDDLAALKLRLAKIVDEYDRDASARILDELLAESPEHLGGLELLVVQAARRGDPKAHAQALLRLAAVQTEFSARATSMLEAARRFRDAGDHRAAIRAYEAASELASDDDQLRAELEEARTALVVERAAADVASGDAAAAERRLRTSLASQPHDLAANHALVDLLVASHRHDAAAEHLQSTLASAPEAMPGPKLAPLVHRLAQVRAALGDDDEAHQLLHEAHRLDREAVLVTLALGESCFARRLWRQAALHLGSLAEHPMASQHARAVAAGLFHAGQAEVRGLRPGNAPKHYQAAVRLDPDCAPAWHALGELAMEKGELEEAARCLEREAVATTAPRDRLRLFDALGDMARDLLHDPERAERCWSQVSELGDATVLEKLLELQRARDATSELADTAERLAAVVDDPARKKSLLAESAQAYALGGNLVRARELADRLLSAHPHDAEAIGCASALALAAGDFADARAMLRRALTAWEATGDRGKGDGRRADLWRRLGDAERQLGDPQSALASYRTSVNLAPDSEGALASRRGLVELASSSGRVEQSALFVLVEAEQAPADVLASARNLAAAKHHEDARATFELARVLGAPLSPDDQRYFDAHPPHALASDEAYSAPLDDADRKDIVDEPADSPLGDVLDIVAEVASLVLPDARTALFDSGFSDAKRLPATSESAASAIYPQIAKAFGGPATLMHVSERAEDDLKLLLASPPVVVLGARFARQRPASSSELDLDEVDRITDELRNDAALRFQLGRIVELARPRRLFAAASTTDAFTRFVRTVWIAAGKDGGAHGDQRELVAEGERLRAKLTVAVRQRLAEKLANIPIAQIDPRAYFDGCQRAADRVGLLACGDAAVAIDLAGGPKVARHLVKLVASKRYLAVRKKLRSRASGEATSPYSR